MSEIISHVALQGGEIENVHIYRSSLEDVFLKLTGKSIHKEEKNKTKQAVLDV